ncbi:MAG: Protein-export protein SecB [Pseudomonadota bacterium]|jgi:preprotein translocase subunit SecB
MAEDNRENGRDAQDASGAQPNIQIIAQYIKDLSFENPNVRKILVKRPDNPNLEIEVNVNAEAVGEGLFESVIDFGAKASTSDMVFYELEISYAGMFRVENLPQEALEPFLLIHCPTLLFPFLRRLIADLTREGGFPPLLLDPLDFASLYEQRRAQASNDNANS